MIATVAPDIPPRLLFVSQDILFPVMELSPLSIETGVRYVDGGMRIGCCEECAHCLSRDFKGWTLDHSRADTDSDGQLSYRGKVQYHTLTASTGDQLVRPRKGRNPWYSCKYYQRCRSGHSHPTFVDRSSGGKEDPWSGFWRHQRRTRVVLDICRYRCPRRCVKRSGYA